jgi:hypothetical protein
MAAFLLCRNRVNVFASCLACKDVQETIEEQNEQRRGLMSRYSGLHPLTVRLSMQKSRPSLVCAQSRVVPVSEPWNARVAPSPPIGYWPMTCKVIY